jgi:hypothetical protein
MNQAQLAEQMLALWRRGGVPGAGPSVEAIRSWVAAAVRSGAVIRAEVETILRGSDWVVGTTTLEHALAACESDRSLMPIPMPDPNLVVHLHYGRQRLSVEHLGASCGAVVHVVVQFPAPPAPPGRLRDALHAALRRSEPPDRIEALLAVLPMGGDVTIQLSILDAATREARRLHKGQRAQWLAAIAQAEYRVLFQSGQWVRYGLLTETQRQGGVAFFAAESWLRTVGAEQQDTVQIGCHLVEADHPWSVEALQDSLDEIREMDSHSRDCWRDWLAHSLPVALQSYRDDLLHRVARD